MTTDVIKEATIPKTIHYCWFGGNPLGPDEMACIESWKKYLPGYEIKLWNENNWDVDCCDYVREAYSAKKWAFVSDYARLDIINRYGGIYFDTDVEVVNAIDDILEHGPFLGMETMGLDGGLGTVNPGLGFASCPNDPLLDEVLAEYAGEHFIKSDGSYNEKTIVDRTTEIVNRCARIFPDGFWHANGFTVYPVEYFNPKDYLTGSIVLTDNTRCIHHFSMSWFTPRRKYKHKVYLSLLSKGVPGRIANYIAVFFATVKFKSFH